MRANASFDGQAAAFDERAGIPEPARGAIADAVLALGRVGVGDTILECGAGTGQVGEHLSAHPGINYIGFDLSAPMLEAFQRRLPPESAARLVCADGDGPWPAADRSVRVVLGIRTFHLMRLDHVVREAMRVAAPDGAVFVAGRTRRNPDGVATRMRRAVRQAVKARGYAPREGEQNTWALLDALVEQGASPLDDVVAARWPTRESPARSLAAWRDKEGLAGVGLDTDEKAAILADVAAWASSTFGDLDTEHPSEEQFILHAVRI